METNNNKSILNSNSSFKSSFDSGYGCDISSMSTRVNTNIVLSISESSLDTTLLTQTIEAATAKNELTPVTEENCQILFKKLRITEFYSENEFLHVLSKNHKLPSNPKLLIGHCMGIEYFDIISELSKRSMKSILSNIFDSLTAMDYISMSNVCKEWRNAIKINKVANNKRIKLSKEIELSKVFHV